MEHSGTGRLLQFDPSGRVEVLLSGLQFANGVALAEDESFVAVAVAEAFWPEGLQPGLGDPVVLELDAAEADMARLAELGYQVFTSVDALRGFVSRRNEESAGVDGGNLVGHVGTSDG